MNIYYTAKHISSSSFYYLTFIKAECNAVVLIFYFGLILNLSSLGSLLPITIF